MDYVIELGRRERKRQVVRQTLLEAARQLFTERGFARTTVDDIADAADVARQTVFNHFPYKEALALELGADYITDVAHHAHALLEAGVPALDVLQRVGEWFVEASTEQGEMAIVVAQELLHAEPDRAAHAAELVPLRTLLEGVLIQAREEGSIRELPLETVARRLSAAVAAIVVQARSARPESLRHDLTVTFDMFLHGITERSK